MADGIRIMQLCNAGLLPKASRGLTVMHTAAGEPTELTCTLKFKPGAKFIAGVRLVNVALCALFLTHRVQIAAMFCKAQWVERSPFWTHAEAILNSATDMPKSIERACMVDNPNVRSFTLRCWYRLRSRLGFQMTEKLLAFGTKAKWPDGHEWTPTIAKWMVQLQTPFAVASGTGGDLIISNIHLAIPMRDKIVLMLMVLFRCPLGYGETKVENNLSEAIGITRFPQLFSAEKCQAHCLINLSIDWRRSQAKT